MKKLFLGLTAGWLALCTDVAADPVPVRIMAANLTAGRDHVYSVDNGNHSNPEAAGTRIIKGVKPDIVLMQEFKIGVNPRQWVNDTLGKDYHFFVEEGGGIPNAIISRYPIVEQGEWKDVELNDRDFAWARIRLPNGRNLWAISVHLKAGNSGAEKAKRTRQTEKIVQQIEAKIPAGDLMVIGGDFNTGQRDEACVRELGKVFHTAAPHPADAQGEENTNRNRRKPYDWVLADAELKPHQVETKIGDQTFAAGLVVDTRGFDPIEAVAPAQKGDSDAEQMQHMGVVKDFLIP
jgi:endonuclease/exonuclease/phosphatase family metal-dependent hydrolase